MTLQVRPSLYMGHLPQGSQPAGVTRPFLLILTHPSLPFHYWSILCTVVASSQPQRKSHLYLAIPFVPKFGIHGLCCPILACHHLLTSTPLSLQGALFPLTIFSEAPLLVLQPLVVRAGFGPTTPAPHGEKEMGPRAVCRAHRIAAEPNHQSEVLSLGTWRPSKPIRALQTYQEAPASGAARQLPPSTAAGVGAAVGRARSLLSSRPRRVSSGRRARQGAGTVGLCLPWPRACGTSRGAASGCCWVSSPGCNVSGDLGPGGQHLNAPYSGHGVRARQ